MMGRSIWCSYIHLIHNQKKILKKCCPKEFCSVYDQPHEGLFLRITLFLNDILNYCLSRNYCFFCSQLNIMFMSLVKKILLESDRVQGNILSRFSRSSDTSVSEFSKIFKKCFLYVYNQYEDYFLKDTFILSQIMCLVNSCSSH